MSSLYEGELVHVRRDRWAARRFTHRLYYVALDLDDLPRLRLLSFDRANLFSLRRQDHDTGWADGARAALRRHGRPDPARIELITQLRTFGYVFNPVSFYLAYDARGALESAIAEIHNTYGARHAYVLAAPDFACTKDFLVSPFIQGDAHYRFRFGDAHPDAPRLDIAVDVLRPDGERIFHARLRGDRNPLDDRSLLAAAIRHPLMPVQVIGLIHYQALRLHWQRVPYRRPA
jgi:DUF1365 family protein